MLPSKRPSWGMGAVSIERRCWAVIPRRSATASATWRRYLRKRGSGSEKKGWTQAVRRE